MPRPDSKVKRFTLNTQSRTLHKYLAREDCNLDQIPRRYRKVFTAAEWSAKKASEGWIHRCGHCFPKRQPVIGC